MTLFLIEAVLQEDGKVTGQCYHCGLPHKWSAEGKKPGEVLFVRVPCITQRALKNGRMLALRIVE